MTDLKSAKWQALYPRQNHMGLEELVSGTIPPRAGRCAQKSSLAARCIYIKLGLLPPKSPKPHGNQTLQTVPPPLPILPLTSSLGSPPTLEPFELVPISGPVDVRQAWNLLRHPQISPPQRGTPPHLPLGSSSSRFLW